MFCTNCGNKLEDHLKFCTRCGCKVNKIDQSIEVSQENKGKKNKLKWILLGLCIISVLTAGIYLWRMSKNSKDILNSEIETDSTLDNTNDENDASAFLQEDDDIIVTNTEIIDEEIVDEEIVTENEFVEKEAQDQTVEEVEPLEENLKNVITYSKDNLPEGFFIKEKDVFKPLKIGLPNGYTNDNFNAVIWTDADNFSEGDFIKLKQGDVIAYKGDFDSISRYIYLNEIRFYGYTFNAMETVGLESFDGEEICASVSYVNDEEVYYLHSYASKHGWDVVGHQGDVFYNDFEIGDEVNIGYFVGTEYFEQALKIDKWVASKNIYDTYAWSESFWLEQTKEGYFEFVLEGMPRSGLYLLNVMEGYSDNISLVWIE